MDMSPEAVTHLKLAIASLSRFEEIIEERKMNLLFNFNVPQIRNNLSARNLHSQNGSSLIYAHERDCTSMPGSFTTP